MKSKLLLSALAVLASLASIELAAAQTGRIAALSHGGSAAAVAAEEAAANFGIPSMRFEVDTIVASSDTTAIVHGREGRFKTHMTRATRTINYGSGYYPRDVIKPSSRGAAVRALQQRYPQAKLIGFDTLAKPQPTVAPETRKQKRQRRRAAAATSAAPRHPGVWLAVATMLGLAGAGLLLGDKPRPKPAA